MTAQQAEHNQSDDPTNIPRPVHLVITEAESQTRRDSSMMATSLPKMLTFSKLPLEIRQIIFENTITPFQRSEAPLRDILDPIFQGDFSYQRETFKAELA